MRITATGNSYAEFKALVDAFADADKVFYGKSGGDVINALVIFDSQNQYVDANFGTGVVTETAFLSDFPNAILATTGAAY